MFADWLRGRRILFLCSCITSVSWTTLLCTSPSTQLMQKQCTHSTLGFAQWSITRPIFPKDSTPPFGFQRSQSSEMIFLKQGTWDAEIRRGQLRNHFDIGLAHPDLLQSSLELSNRHFPRTMEPRELQEDQREESNEAESCSESDMRRKPKPGKADHHLKIPLSLYSGRRGEGCLLILGSD